MSPRCCRERYYLASILILSFLLGLVCSEQEVIVAIDEPGKTQYHEANFNTSSYQYGYEVGPNGQFHHETRGPDGVTYGCYGYIDPNGMLRVTHYVADTHGYRVVEPNRPVEIFADAPTQYSNSIAEEETTERRRGTLRPWTELYLPKGCGMFPGGMRPDGTTGAGPGSGGGNPTPPGGISLGAGVSAAGISGSASTSHTGTNHSISGTIGGSVGTGGVQAGAGANASATILGTTVDHTHSTNVTVTSEGAQVSHGGQNTIDAQHVTVAGSVGVAVGIAAGTIEGSLNHTEHVSGAGVSVSNAMTVGAGIEANSTSVGVGAHLTHNASISIPPVGQGPTTQRPGQEGPEPTPSTPVPGSPGTAIGVYPPTKPIDTSSPPASGSGNGGGGGNGNGNGGGDGGNQYPPNYQIAVSQYPYFFVPYPYAPPYVPQAPCNCPADQQNPNQTPQGQQPTGYLGFIPVIYIPNCHAQKSGLPANFNWPAPPPPEGQGQPLADLPAQRLFQKPDGSWVLQRARNRSRRLRTRRPPSVIPQPLVGQAGFAKK